MVGFEEIKEVHRCEQPKITGTTGTGTTWRCDECSSLWHVAGTTYYSQGIHKPKLYWKRGEPKNGGCGCLTVIALAFVAALVFVGLLFAGVSH